MALDYNPYSYDDYIKDTIKLEDIQRAMGKVKEARTGGYVGPAIPASSPKLVDWRPSNPCDEIVGGTIYADKIQVGSIGMNKLIVNKIYKEKFALDFERNTWTIEVPGVPRDKIEVFTVDRTDESEAGNTIYVRVDGQQLQRTIAWGEKLDSVDLDLGVLTIVITLPFKKTVIEVK